MKKEQIQAAKGYNRKLPSNIVEFLKDRPEQKAKATKVNNWLLDILGRSICGGTAVGKHYSTLILDITWQGGEISINEDGQISFRNNIIENKKQFNKTFLEHYEIIK